MFDFVKNKEARQIDQFFKEAKTKINKDLEPMKALGFEIVRASQESKERTKYLILVEDKDGRAEREILLFFECLYFFSFFGSMNITSLLSKPKSDQVLTFLGSIIPDVAVDSYFAHWPTEMKAKIREDFIEKLAAQEDEYYAALNKSSSDDERFSNMFGQFAANVIQLCERENQYEDLFPAVFEIVFDEAQKSRFDLITKRIA